MSREEHRTTPAQPTQPPTSRVAPPPGKGNQRKGGTSKRLANGLVALSTAAVMAIYGVGYARTAPAAANTFAAPLVVATPEVAAVAPTATATLAATATATATTPPATATSTTTATRPARGRGSSGTTASAAITTTPTASSAAANTGTTASAATTPTASASASASAGTPATTTASTATDYQDGTYTGTGTSRHGSIGVTVVISGGKIVSAEITQCGTRYPCSKIANLPGQVIARQSANVDFVSGSTDSSTAYKSAVAAALAQAD